jgi:hypothetical protein
MNHVDKFLDAISVLEPRLRRRLGREVEIEIGCTLAENFEAMTPSERSSVWSTGVAGSSIGRKLLGLSGLLPEEAIDKNRPELLRMALILHAIEDFQCDPRENILRLVLIAYAAHKLNVPLAPMIASISNLATDNGKQHLDAFARRGFAFNQLSSFGIRAEETTGAFRFVPVQHI